MLPDPWLAPTPAAPVRAQVSVPGSKSLTNRALVLAAVADGPSLVRNALRSRDTELMAAALESLGARVGPDGADWHVTPADWRTSGSVECGLAGTVMRFVPPLAGLCAGAVRFDGDAHARRRPMSATIDTLRQLGVEVDDEGRGSLPFTVLGTGKVPGGEVRLDASSSSQFVSALLLAGARFERGVDVRHVGPPVPSRPHLDMTVAALRARGVRVDDSEPDRWVVEPGPVRALDVTVEPDLSNAAPFLAAAAVTRGEVTVRDWPTTTTQPGAVLPGLLERMGATSRLDDRGLTLRADGPLQGIDLDMHEIGELAPVVAALCALATGPSRLRGLTHIRGHETDRLRALTAELTSLGCQVEERPDGLDLTPAPMRGGLFHTYDDHRMAHAAAVLGLRVEGVEVENIATTSKTFPGFEQVWESMLTALRRGPMSDHRRFEHLDHESFDRPRRRTRPRTKERPSYDDAVGALVVAVDRGRLTVVLDEDETRVVSAVKSRHLGRKGVVVGDRVRLVGDLSGADGSLARIVTLTERTTVLRRTADDSDPVERVVVANADQLVIVVALAEPEPRTGLIDRAIAAAYDAGIDPLLCLTKADLADPAPLADIYRPLQVPHVVTRRDQDPAELRERLAGRTSVLLGHSGVGKSTLVNALVPGAGRATGGVNDVTGRGRHTSTSAVMLRLPDPSDGTAGWIVDTPGIRSFGLAHLAAADLLTAFPDLQEATVACPRGCTHEDGAPECALDLAESAVDPERVASYRRLLASRDVGA